MIQLLAASPRRPQRRIAELVALVAGALLLFGCGTIQHGRATADIEGRTLATGSSLGSERLTSEIDYDRTVRATVRAHGRPEYLHVVDRDTLYLFFTELNRVVMIQRNLIPPGVVSEYAPIPGHFLKLLPKAEIARNQARRQARRTKRLAARQTARAAAPPAARKPASANTARTLNRFDVEMLIQRFRTPISAADPGVQGWRFGKLADGSRSAFARTGDAEYRISSNSVLIASRIGANSRKTPAGLRLGYYRVNRVVFGTRAHAISDKVARIVASVANDPSGRTRVAKRVAGRTVRITRDTAKGLLIYRVGTD
jgi:hypothetical protein